MPILIDHGVKRCSRSCASPSHDTAPRLARRGAVVWPVLTRREHLWWYENSLQVAVRCLSASVITPWKGKKEKKKSVPLLESEVASSLRGGTMVVGLGFPAAVGAFGSTSHHIISLIPGGRLMSDPAAQHRVLANHQASWLGPPQHASYTPVGLCSLATGMASSARAALTPRCFGETNARYLPSVHCTSMITEIASSSAARRGDPRGGGREKVQSVRPGAPPPPLFSPKPVSSRRPESVIRLAHTPQKEKGRRSWQGPAGRPCIGPRRSWKNSKTTFGIRLLCALFWHYTPFFCSPWHDDSSPFPVDLEEASKYLVSGNIFSPQRRTTD